MGHASESDDIQNGDILVKITVEENAVFKRINDDVHYNLELSLSDAIFGCKKQVTLMSGNKINVEVPQGSQGDDKLVLKEKVFFLFYNLF